MALRCVLRSALVCLAHVVTLAYLKTKRIEDGAGFPVEVSDSEAPCNFSNNFSVALIL